MPNPSLVSHVLKASFSGHLPVLLQRTPPIWHLYGVEGVACDTSTHPT